MGTPTDRTRSLTDRAVASFALAPSVGFLLASTISLAALHGVIWVVIADFSIAGLTDVLCHWDAAHYSHIAHHGYSSTNWAFYPLYPMAVAGLSRLLGSDAYPWIGLGLSTALYLAFVGLVSRLDATSILRPRTRLAWLLFLCAPASYVFHSHHTEALFLLVSFLAFRSAERGRLVEASLFAGLCALTRAHGVLMAIVVALWLAEPPGAWRFRLKRFATSGFISGALFSLYPGYQLLRTGDALTFVRSEANWAHASSVAEYLRTFLLANPWQNSGLGSLLEYATFLGLIAAAALLSKRSKPLALLVLLYLLIMPLQGQLVNVFRFSAVLFPAWFAIGDHLASRRRPVAIVLLAAMLALNLAVATNYALHRWAY